MLSGDNGILQRATDAKTNTDNSQIQERINLAYHSALTKDITRENGELTMPTLQEELDNEFTGKAVTITPSADNKEWTIKVDDVEETVPAGKKVVVSKLTDDEKKSLSENGIAEISGDNIENSNLKNNNRIKAILTGEVPLTTEMTYLKGTKNTGVVVSIDDNEFVWVPVDDINKMIMCTNNNKDGHKCNIQLVGTELKCEKTGAANQLCGKLYITEDNHYEINSNMDNQTYLKNSGAREPDILTGDYSDLSSYNTAGVTEDLLKTEFYDMALSVAKYKGFYIARYELGIENGTPVSKNASINSNIVTANSGLDNTKTWYGLYKKEKEMYNDSSKNIRSSMIWGCQYDAMMIWMKNTGNNIEEVDTTKRNMSPITGMKANQYEDIINNIYDIYGCHSEWTLAASSACSRLIRGGSYSFSIAPTRCAEATASSSGSVSSNDSSRPTLYIK